VTQRRITGTIVFPPDAQAGRAARVLVELRDISLQDVPSSVLASCELKRQAVGPGLELPFEMTAPEADPTHSLAVRVQVDMSATRGARPPRMLLTTAIWPVPPRGEANNLRVTLQQL
jgi:uncharacterized lipoprotein YbaY